MLPPKADNTLNAYGVFEQRKTYELQVFDELFPQPIDLWYEKPLYGKVDLYNNNVFPSQAFLKQTVQPPGSPNSVFVLNFVADAFRDFQNAIDRFTVQGNVRASEDSVLVNISAKKGWVDSGDLYNIYMDSLYRAFSNVFVSEKGRDDKIRNFKTFIPIFIEFVSIINPKRPITRTGFTQTQYFNPLSTGLMIEFLDNQDASSDQIKYETIVNDPNFDFFATEAQRYSFYIDKNVPWRLVFDVNSIQTQQYLQPYGLNLENLFETFYYKTYEFDIDTLKIYVLQFYNSYVGSNPYVRVPKQSNKCRNKTFTETVLREQITLDKLNQEYDNRFWIRLYTYLRAIENDAILEQVQFENIVKKASDIERYVSLEKAVEFINKKFRNKDVRFFARQGRDLPSEVLDFENRVRSFRF